MSTDSVHRRNFPGYSHRCLSYWQPIRNTGVPRQTLKPITAKSVQNFFFFNKFWFVSFSAHDHCHDTSLLCFPHVNFWYWSDYVYYCPHASPQLSTSVLKVVCLNAWLNWCYSYRDPGLMLMQSKAKGKAGNHLFEVILGKGQPAASWKDKPRLI